MKYQVVMHLFFKKTGGSDSPFRDIIDFVVDSEKTGDDSSIAAQIEDGISQGAEQFYRRMNPVNLLLIGTDTMFCHPIEESIDKLEAIE